MKKKTIIILLILTFAIYALNVNVQITAEENNYRPTSLELSPHDPIEIRHDSDFEVFPGSGTVEDPFVIEGYNITTTSNRGIYINGTTKYFTIRNCYIDADDFGIFFGNVADGTATIANNTCNNNINIGILFMDSYSSNIINNTCNYNGIGIWFEDSDYSTVANNTCNNNNGNGILLRSSVSSTVSNNSCSNNDGYGIFLGFSFSSTVSNNTCNNNDLDGIHLRSSGDSTVTNNTCISNNGDCGIFLYASGFYTVINNTCSNSNWGIMISYSESSTVADNTCTNNGDGIYLSSSHSCLITYNFLQENEGYGVYLFSNSANNIIHHNNFVDNNPLGSSQAKDNGANNKWYNTETLEGNHWSDWSGTGSYSINGDANSVDLYPLGEPVVVEYPQIVLLTLILSIVPFLLLITISKKVKKE